MADKFRYVKGDTNPRRIRVDSATVIEKGDLVFLDTNDAKPAKDESYTTLAGTQEAFHDHFAGVAQDRSRALDTADIMVATTGVFEYAAASTTFDEGKLVGMDDNVGGTALLNQTVIAVATENLAVGHVTKAVASAATLVQLEIHSVVYGGGTQAPA